MPQLPVVIRISRKDNNLISLLLWNADYRHQPRPVIRIIREDHIRSYPHFSFSVTCKSMVVAMLTVLPAIRTTSKDHNLTDLLLWITTTAILTVLPVIRITSENHTLNSQCSLKIEKTEHYSFLPDFLRFYSPILIADGLPRKLCCSWAYWKAFLISSFV